jgi:hypothetical protein
MSRAGRKKGIFGRVRRKRGNDTLAREPFETVRPRKSREVAAAGASRTERCYEPLERGTGDRDSRTGLMLRWL